uniref:Uncharacterized protein n=1 Tax=Arundo donax TaxID=35708 RepID=A0A0A8Z2C2_ARUDO
MGIFAHHAYVVWYWQMATYVFVNSKDQFESCNVNSLFTS